MKKIFSPLLAILVLAVVVKSNPVAPLQIICIPGNGKVTICLDVLDPYSQIKSWDVYRSVSVEGMARLWTKVNSQPIPFVVDQVNSYVDTTVINGVEYVYWVKGDEEFATSDWITVRPSGLSYYIPPDTIASFTVWSKEHSPYLIQRPLVIMPEVKLLIQPGTRILLLGTGQILVQGELVCEGKPHEPIEWSGTRAWSDDLIVPMTAAVKLVFRFCHFTNFAAEPIVTKGFLVIENCIFAHNELWLSIANYSIIRHNLFYENLGRFYFNGGQDSCLIEGNVIFRNHQSGIALNRRPVLINNTIVQNNNNGIEGYWLSEHSTIWNNVVVSNGGYGISGNRNKPLCEVFNNNVWQNSLGNYINVTNPHDISADPQFANPKLGDFSLLPTSPCIDAGTDAILTFSIGDTTVELNYLGNKPDIGAFEYGRTPAHLRIFPKEAVVLLAGTQRFHVIAQDSSGYFCGLGEVEWQLDNPSIGVVDDSLIFRSSGSFGSSSLIVSSTTYGLADTAMILVPEPTRLVIVPHGPNIETDQDSTIQFSALGFDDEEHPATVGQVSWQLLAGQQFATLTSSGKLIATAEGWCEVAAENEFGHLTDTLRFEVRLPGQSGVSMAEENAPVQFGLQNFPNPFRISAEKTTFQFQLTQPMHVTLKIYNLLGQQIYTVIDRQLQAGLQLFSWDGRDTFGQPVASGIYFARLEGNVGHRVKTTATHKFLVLR
ncbi:right-handed parallel beta-helix repeat-containing protein [bacterium]|nr:right-handed parallel beta-helix repeat-containing protein [bacterium]